MTVHMNIRQLGRHLLSSIVNNLRAFVKSLFLRCPGVVVRVWWRKREAAENKVGSFVWKKNGHREQRINGKYSKWRRAGN